MTFADLGLSPEILKAIADTGYESPTPIQEQAIPQVLMSRDVLGCAQTGTGKTAGFTLPMIEILASGRARARMPRSLIIEPTRELAAQVAESFERYGKYHKLNCALLIGGSSFSEQEQSLSRGVDVLIATPGRLLDLFERGKILLADVKILVIDESDRMLDMGFMPDVERIVSKLPKIRQTLFFSATMPPEIRRLSEKFLMNPKEISVSPPATTADTVKQSMLRVPSVPKDKRAAFRELMRSEDINTALIFCNRKRDVGVLHRSLVRHGFSAAALHGDMAQPVRMETLSAFKNREVDMMVCSDVAARGLDMPAVSHVFNFDVPVNAEDYVHRIGRTGRAGRSGVAFTLVSREDSKAWAAVTRLVGKKIDEIRLDGAPPAEEPAQDEAEDGAEARTGRSSRRSRQGRNSGPRRQSEARSGDKRDGRTNEAEPQQADAEPRPRKADSKKRESAPRARDGEDRKSKTNVEPLATQSRPGKPFGDHTPAFMLRPVKLAANA